MSQSIMSAFWIACCERRMPSSSMESAVWRIPAVSISRNTRPLIVMVSSMVSRVVPGMSDTIALSSPVRALSRVDFPAFGLPTIATGIPFLIALPVRYESANDLVTLRRFCVSSARCVRSANSTSSSEKSSSSSSSAPRFIICVRSSSRAFEYCPLVWDMASR